MVEQSARRLTEAGIGHVHDLLMRILLELDATTKAAGVSYYLAYGTALGAFRHRDFIPWDIDADVFIWSHEYEQLIEALRTRLPQDVTLYTPEEDRGYEYLFARLGVRGVDHTRVHVDLFPLEPAPASRWKQRVYAVGTRLCCQMYLVKQMSSASRTHYTREKRLVARVGKMVLTPVRRGSCTAGSPRSRAGSPHARPARSSRAAAAPTDCASSSPARGSTPPCLPASGAASCRSRRAPERCSSGSTATS